MIVETIRKRTLAGKFAREGSSGSRARRYNRKYARSVGKSESGPVDLFVTGQLHSAIRGRGRVNKKSVRAEAYIHGSSARRKFQYIQVQGSGPNRIKRRFMYLNKTESQKIVKAMIAAAKAT